MQFVIESSRPVAHVTRELYSNEGTLGNWIQALVTASRIRVVTAFLADAVATDRRLLESIRSDR